jgi:cell division protein FtsL
MYIKKTNFVFLGLMAVALSTCATRKDILKVQEELYYLRNQIQTIKQTTENNQKNLAELPAEIAAQNTSILSELTRWIRPLPPSRMPQIACVPISA